jgi:hypothetical protein
MNYSTIQLHDIEDIALVSHVSLVFKLAETTAGALPSLQESVVA